MLTRSRLPFHALGLIALVAATSCVPMRAAPAPARPIAREEAQLLRRLALTPPPAAEAAPLPDAPAVVTPFTGAPAFIPATGDDAARAVECLTAAVYYESRSEPTDGQRAVAQVVLNRVRDRAFPHSVCGVVYQRTATVCQFSFACDGSMNRPREPGAWDRARAIAAAAYDGQVFAPAGAATHFHTAAISPWWAPSLARVGQIGAHIFYGWRGSLVGALTFRQAYGGIEPGAAPLPRAADTLIADAVMGVTVHRPTDKAAGDDAPPAPRVLFTAGVQIHRKATAPDTPNGYGAIVGPEELPDAT